MEATVLAAVIAGLIAWTEVAQGSPPPLRVVLASGQRAADGVGIASFGEVRARTARDVTFLGDSSAIVVRTADSTVRVLAATGDPLPAPLQGSYNVVASPTVNAAGVVAFGATLNVSGSSVAGAFLYEGAGPRLAVATGFLPGRLTLNGSGDLAYARGQTIYLWRRSTGEQVRVADLPEPGTGLRRGRLRGPLALSDDRVIAFAADERERGAPGGGVFVWEPGAGVRAVARVGDTIAGLQITRDDRSVVAMNGAGVLAFTAQTNQGIAVFRHVVATRETTLVATDADVDGRRLRAARTFVAVDPAGLVIFQVQASGGRRAIVAAGGAVLAVTALGAVEFAAGSPTPGGVVWVRDGILEGFAGPVLTPVDARLAPGLALSGPRLAGGTLVCQANRRALYRLRRGRAEPVLWDGATVDGFGRIGEIGAYDVQGEALVVQASNPEFTASVLLLARGGHVRKIAADGDPLSPLGSLSTVGSPAAVTVARRALLFDGTITGLDGVSLPALFRVDRVGRPARILLRAGDRAPGLETFASLAWLPFPDAPHPLFLAELSAGQTGVFVIRGWRMTRLVVEGEGMGPLERLADIDVSGGRLRFTTVNADDGRSVALYTARMRGVPRIRRIASTGESAPDGGTFGVFTLVRGGGDLFRATVEPGGAALFRGTRTLRRVVSESDAVAGGGNVGGIDQVATGGRLLGYEGTRVTAAGAAEAGVFVVRGGRIRSVFTYVAVTPLGGQIDFATSRPTADGGFIVAATLTPSATAREALLATGPLRDR